MDRIGTVETICRYPVKSMAGEEVGQAFVGFAGLMGDRAFAFVRTSGPKGFPWHTGREQEDLILFRPHFREGGATTLPPNIEESFKMAPGVNPIFPTPSRSTSGRPMA
jgi:MOSC domain-containing protein